MILILNGSPRKESTTMKITNELIKNSKQEVVIIDSYKKHIQSCDDCKYCTKKIGCSKNDDMNAIYPLLYKTDTLIISSPIYFGAVSDQLLAIINRFQRYYGQKFELKDSNLPRINQLITITTQGSVRRKMFRGATLTHEILCSLFQPQKQSLIQATNSDIEHPLHQKKIQRKIKSIQQKYEL